MFDSLKKKKNSLTCKKLMKLLKLTFFWFREFLIGIGILIIVIEAIKYSIGTPRPHFLDSCKPDKNIDCIPGYLAYFNKSN